MSSRRSWFAQSSSSKSRVLSNSSHELPRWRSPSPSASLIPPPIVQSRYLPAESTASQSILVEKPTEFEDRQLEIEADIQFLLDAQAEGLIRGVNEGSTGSTTPTIQTTRSPMDRARRRPARKQLGLRSARKGIYNSIIALASLKAEELRDIDAEVHEHDDTLGQIDAWNQKRQGLQNASRHVDSEEETVRVQRLQQEASALQMEINQVEMSLVEMKTRHKQLLKQAAAVENAVQARLSSFNESLRELDRTIDDFLRINPDGANTRAAAQDVKASIWHLPPERRNLDRAKEYWTEQREQAELRKKSSEFEKAALIEGAKLWAESVTEINDFEKHLREEMATLRSSSPDSQSAWEDPATDRMQHLIEKVDAVAESLHAKLLIAEDKNWKLLQASLGAELDALSRGKQILVGALMAAGGNPAGDSGGRDNEKADSGEAIDALDQSFSTTRHIDGDDEEPPPELLFSRIDNE
ncbi:hypothetical protein Slin15195_G004340 [Septoria linicola]|uniref:Autophagy-related protein 28 n=1 Tax=Septoria linicola TaxID=215465 RepID=A0A9Q9EDS5_9PEZI|nr:hypothetical protein Slin14017_G004370 [Septoria linicola]USW47115.1 hypothetical protein Slin15195_G004340 [Septoria linicola]